MAMGCIMGDGCGAIGVACCDDDGGACCAC